MSGGQGPGGRTPPRVLVMTRHPTPGQVKTRLAARIGAMAAARLHAAFITDLAVRLSGAGLAVTWAVTPPDAPFADLLPAARIVPQTSGDLGARMRAAIDQLFAEGPGTIVTIGSDLPHLDPGAVFAADALLAGGADCVLGPALDGGYYLIGLRRPVPEVLDGIDWGTERVLAQTLERAAAAGVAVAQLSPAFDVDGWDDLRALHGLLQRGAVALPATAEALASIPDLD